MRTIALILLLSSPAFAQTIPFGVWESDTASLAGSLDDSADQLVDPPPEGQRFTAEATAKINAMRSASQSARDAALLTVADVYEDIPVIPPGQDNVFGRNTYVLEYQRHITVQATGEEFSQASGLTEGPYRSLWCITDNHENGGLLHELDTDGNVLRSINWPTTFSIDHEEIVYMGETSPGVGLWAICSEAGHEGVLVFSMPHDQPDQSSIDIDPSGGQAWFHATGVASEAMALSPLDGKLHLCSDQGYVVVGFDFATKTFTEDPGSFNSTGAVDENGQKMGGSNRSGVKGMSFLGPSMFRLRSSSSVSSVQEIDYTTPWQEITPDNRPVSVFSGMVQPIGEDLLSIHNPKLEGGPVWNLDGDPEDCFYTVGEGYWYGSKPSYTFRRFRRIP